MDRDTLAETIFARMAAPYGEFITPALTQQLRISANLAAEDILEQLRPQRSSRVVAMKGAPPIDRDERNRRIAEAYEAGMSMEQVGRMFAMSFGGVQYVLEEMGIERRPRGTRTPPQFRNVG